MSTTLTTGETREILSLSTGGPLIVFAFAFEVACTIVNLLVLICLLFKDYRNQNTPYIAAASVTIIIYKSMSIASIYSVTSTLVNNLAGLVGYLAMLTTLYTHLEIFKGIVRMAQAFQATQLTESHIVWIQRLTVAFYLFFCLIANIIALIIVCRGEYVTDPILRFWLVIMALVFSAYCAVIFATVYYLQMRLTKTVLSILADKQGSHTRLKGRLSTMLIYIISYATMIIIGFSFYAVSMVVRIDKWNSLFNSLGTSAASFTTPGHLAIARLIKSTFMTMMDSKETSEQSTAAFQLQTKRMHQ
ncbi:hypothetical protein EDD86DRAFT_197221 [Gorgonomyces haynaldii]|nr:hypothetical protein EDD86DRAFT_197221 [Gorgonomyces haynaldii]